MRALVLSGGGGHGAYQAGALSHILGDLRIHYDAVVGVSVGAINGLSVAMFRRGDEGRASAALESMWGEIRTRDVVRPRFLQPLSLLWSSSTHSTDPLRSYLDERLDIDRLRSSGKAYRAVAVDVRTGRFTTWTENHEREELLRGVMASSASPILHPPIDHAGRLMYDGGIRTVTPTRQAIALGATELDVIVTRPSELPDWPEDVHRDTDEIPSDRIWHTGPRVLEIMTTELIEGDLRSVRLYSELVAAGLAPGKRQVRLRVLRPREVLPGDPSRFDPNDVRAAMLIGRRDAVRQGGWNSNRRRR